MAMRPNQQLRPKIQEGATVCTKAGVRDCVAKTEKTNGCDWGRVTGRVCVCVCVCTPETSGKSIYCYCHILSHRFRNCEEVGEKMTVSRTEPLAWCERLCHWACEGKGQGTVDERLAVAVTGSQQLWERNLTTE